MARFCDSNQKRGLTLVELIVVLVILAVLAALLVPSLTGYIDKAVEKRVMLQARSLMTAAQATIDEAYAKGELPIDNKGRFKSYFYSMASPSRKAVDNSATCLLAERSLSERNISVTTTTRKLCLLP